MKRPEAVECRTCKALVFWVITAKGKRMPMDAGAVPDGGFVLTLKADGQLHAEAFDRLQHPGNRNRYVSHFVTCPQRNDWRKPE